MARRLQLPNFTPFPDEIIDRHLPDLTGPEVKILLYVLRKTLRYGKREFTVTQAEIGGPCGLDRSVVCRSCKHLVEMDLLIVDKNSMADGSCAASTYGVAFEDEGGCAPAAQGVCTSSTGGSDKSPQHKESIEKTNIERALTPPTPLSISDSDLDLEDSIDKFVVNSCRRTTGIRLKPKGWLERWEQAEGKYGAEYLRRYWLNFLEHYRTHRKEIEVPQAYFLKNPERWDSGNPETLQDAPVSTPSPVTPTAAPSTPPAPRVDYLARWNELVPAKQCTDWSPKREQHLLDRALDDPELSDSFDRVCARVQKILTARPDCDWLSFRWILGSKSRRMNWWRLLTEMEWMEKPEMSRSGYSSPGLDEAAKKRILDSMREDEDAED